MQITLELPDTLQLTELAIALFQQQREAIGQSPAPKAIAVGRDIEAQTKSF